MGQGSSLRALGESTTHHAGESYQQFFGQHGPSNGNGNLER